MSEALKYFLSSLLTLAGVIISVIASNKALMDKMDKDNAVADEKIRGEIAIVKNDVQQLRGDVQKHNNVIERTYRLEQDSALHEEQIKVANHRIADLENELKSKGATT